ncbi:MAG: hypothetical protein K0S78_1760 [Thermomicrobiales bacterium]|jgi:hypothetical protein|nr:hypothetical protein [Thermomicrobiales bacterium]
MGGQRQRRTNEHTITMVPHPSTLVFLAGQRQADYQAEAGRERLARLATGRRDVRVKHLRVRPQGLLPMRLRQRLLPVPGERNAVRPMRDGVRAAADSCVPRVVGMLNWRQVAPSIQAPGAGKEVKAHAIR